MDADELLTKVARGEASSGDLEAAANQLRAREGNSDPYTLLLALGRSGDRRIRDIVERYLVDPSDPMLTRLALQVACRYWGEVDRYVSHVERFLAGVTGDEENDVRQMAVSIAGDYLQCNENKRLLSLLLQMVQDEALSEFQRSAAYIALAHAMGKSRQELPRPTRMPPFEQLVDPALVAAARLRLSS